jgi:hypothetical protein
MKVARLTLGDLPACHVLLSLKSDGMGRQKSAEVVRVGLTIQRRTKPVTPDMSRISDLLEQMPRKRALKPEVADGIREVRLGAL